jgi:putative oxygen-independent coproporphyrinogen III oxidase
MPGALPLADPAPADGLLPPSAGAAATGRALGVYLHVPFCRVRCGYCDFNTYTGSELRGARQSDFADSAIAEARFAAAALAASGVPHRPLDTVFFGGGTPTMLPVDDLRRMLAGIAKEFGIAAGAEVTTEANPDSVDRAYLTALAGEGFTRVSFGMQSAVPRVLSTLERTHDPARIPLVVGWARDAGLDVSLDLIYGTPGETLADWRTSLDAVVSESPDHLSAYALIVEDGTKLARQIRRGEVPRPSDDLQADMYELADEMLRASGYQWYEVSNWARHPWHRSRHNLGYWRGDDWWGIGPGAHSHVGGVRWWNVRHPAAYAERMATGVSPAAGRETLDAGTRAVEQVMLRTRIRDGLRTCDLTATGRAALAGLIADDLIDVEAALAGSVVLTLRGRLLADVVVRRILASEPTQ